MKSLVEWLGFVRPTSHQLVVSPDPVHYPLSLECSDPDCEGPGIPCDDTLPICSGCGQAWPCTTRREQVVTAEARRARVEVRARGRLR